MRRWLSGLWLLAMAVIVTGSARAVDPAHPGFIDPKPVTLQRYNGVAMEPFISRDGRYLFFNNSNEPGVDTNLYIADRVDDLTFSLRGPLDGANSRDLDAVASMDRFGTFYFVSPRDYGATGSLIHRGRFDGRRVTGVEVVPGLASKDHPGFHFDAEISADGQQLYYVQGRRGARIASLAVAERRGSGFVKAAGSDALLARVNALGMVYAPDISADGLELFFTRLPPGLLLFQPPPQIYLATRAAADQPFGQPVRLTGLGTFVEAPSLSPDGRWLYFHACAKGVCRLFAARRATDK